MSVVCAPEIISALNRRIREGSVSPGQYREAKERLFADVADATIVNLTPEVIVEAIAVLESSPARTLDALHVACAVRWNAGLFVSSDERQLSAAKKAKLRTRKA